MVPLPGRPCADHTACWPPVLCISYIASCIIWVPMPRPRCIMQVAPRHECTFVQSAHRHHAPPPLQCDQIHKARLIQHLSDEIAAWNLQRHTGSGRCPHLLLHSSGSRPLSILLLRRCEMQRRSISLLSCHLLAKCMRFSVPQAAPRAWGICRVHFGCPTAPLPVRNRDKIATFLSPVQPDFLTLDQMNDPSVLPTKESPA